MINKKFKPAVAAVMTGAILAGTAACPMVTFAADSVDLNSMTLDDITAKAKEAAAVMKLTAADLYEKGIIEQVIPEPENLTPESMWQVAERLNDKICTFLQKYTSLSAEELLETRYARFRKF